MAVNPYNASEVTDPPSRLPGWQNAAFIVSSMCLAGTILGHSILLALGLQFTRLPGGALLLLASALGILTGAFAGKGRRGLCVCGNVCAVAVPVILCVPQHFWPW